MNFIVTKYYESDCGTLRIGAFGNRLCMADWLCEPHHGRVVGRLRRMLGAEITTGCTPVIDMAFRQLDEYFTGRRTAFDVPLLPVGTDFQQAVWQALLAIPYGATMTYADIARCLGRDSSVRAVAGAIGSNPLSIFIPCHRVVGSNGALTGYAGGIDAKLFLLNLENQI